jgi:hypothetical protein
MNSSRCLWTTIFLEKKIISAINRGRREDPYCGRGGKRIRMGSVVCAVLYYDVLCLLCVQSGVRWEMGEVVGVIRIFKVGRGVRFFGV